MRHALLVILVLAGSGFLAWCALELAGAFAPPDPLPEPPPKPGGSRSGEPFVADALPRHAEAGAYLGPEDVLASALPYERKT